MSSHAIEQHAQEQANITEQLVREAMSKRHLAALGPVAEYPRELQWVPTGFGMLVETDGSQHLLPYDGPIIPGHWISRLIRPEFNMGLVGSC